jgi:hypothetical protein
MNATVKIVMQCPYCEHDIILLVEDHEPERIEDVPTDALGMTPDDYHDPERWKRTHPGKATQ